MAAKAKARLEPKMCTKGKFFCVSTRLLGGYFLGPHCLTSDLVSWFQTYSHDASDDDDARDVRSKGTTRSVNVTSLSSQPIPDMLK